MALSWLSYSPLNFGPFSQFTLDLGCLSPVCLSLSLSFQPPGSSLPSTMHRRCHSIMHSPPASLLGHHHLALPHVFDSLARFQSKPGFLVPSSRSSRVMPSLLLASVTLPSRTSSCSKRPIDLHVGIHDLLLPPEQTPNPNSPSLSLCAIVATAGLPSSCHLPS